MSESDTAIGDLTRPEAMVLSTIYRFQPLTAYRVRRLFADAPVSSFSNSTGTVYPVIRRLTGQGLLASVPVEGSRRGAEMLTCTAAGRVALRGWVRRIDDDDLILVDPARSKMSCFALLTPAERTEWLRELLVKMKASLIQLEAFGRQYADVPFAPSLQDNFESTLHSRMAWVERSLANINPDVPD